MSANVDVLAVMSGFMLLAGEVVPHWNIPRSTGTIARRLRFRPRACDGRVVMHKTPTTATVLRAMQRAEREGLVVCVPGPSPGWNANAAARAEHHWQLTDAALARVQGGAQ